MRGYAGRWFAVATLLLSAMVMFPAAVRAGTQHVTNCGGSGPGSLPAVVAAAGAGDTVVFDLDCANGSTIPLSNTIVIDRDLTIDGTGHAVAVRGLGVTALSIIGNTTALIVALTIANGYAGGAGIGNAGATTLINVTVSGNIASFGYGAGIYNAGTLVVSGSTISGNAVQGGNVPGGGIFNRGTLSVSGSTITGNSAPGGGGGIFNVGIMTVRDSVVSLNTATSSGGGILNRINDPESGNRGPGQCTIERSSISGNRSFGSGGGIYLGDGSVDVRESTFDANTARGGGAIGTSVNGGTLTLMASTLTGNNANSDDGGGMLIIAGTVTVTNSTYSGNRASKLAGTFTGGSGGAVYNATSASVMIVNATVSGNTAELDGGGLYSEPGSVVMVTNTIISGNGPRDVSFSVVSGGHNLIGNASGASGFIASDLLNVDPHLYPLGTYGGPTQTMALYPNSPAIDQVPASGANCPATDQRGIARPQGAACDIGAFELSGMIPGQNPAPPPRAAPTLPPPPPDPAPPPRGSGASGSGAGPTPNPLPPSR